MPVVKVIEQRRKGMMLVIVVGVDYGKGRLSMRQEFYGACQRPSAQRYAEWLKKLLRLEAEAKAKKERGV
jgi:hypothetical protein